MVDILIWAGNISVNLRSPLNDKKGCMFPREYRVVLQQDARLKDLNENGNKPYFVLKKAILSHTYFHHKCSKRHNGFLFFLTKRRQEAAVVSVTAEKGAQENKCS